MGGSRKGEKDLADEEIVSIRFAHERKTNATRGQLVSAISGVSIQAALSASAVNYEEEEEEEEK